MWRSILCKSPRVNGHWAATTPSDLTGALRTCKSAATSWWACSTTVKWPPFSSPGIVDGFVRRCWNEGHHGRDPDDTEPTRLRGEPQQADSSASVEKVRTKCALEILMADPCKIEKWGPMEILRINHRFRKTCHDSGPISRNYLLALVARDEDLTEVTWFHPFRRKKDPQMSQMPYSSQP
jgi:hypothetical protein